MNSFRSGWLLSLSRINTRWWLGALGWSIGISLIGLLIEHRSSPSTSADNTLLGVTLGVVVPGIAWFSVKKVFPERVELGLAGVARHGADRRWALLGALSALMLGAGTTAAVLATGTRLLGGSSLAQGPSDVLTCSWVAALAGAAYAAWFLLGATFGRKGQGRWALLGLDVVLGMGSSALAAAWPRGYLRQLMGGVPVANLEQPVASAVLGVLVAVYLGLCVWRTAQ